MASKDEHERTELTDEGLFQKAGLCVCVSICLHMPTDDRDLFPLLTASCNAPTKSTGPATRQGSSSSLPESGDLLKMDVQFQLAI